MSVWPMKPITVEGRKMVRFWSMGLDDGEPRRIAHVVDYIIQVRVLNMLLALGETVVLEDEGVDVGFDRTLSCRYRYPRFDTPDQSKEKIAFFPWEERHVCN